MTAMCDVAFLLLSFFILATKQKPPEAVTVQMPSSISAKVAKEEAIIITLNKEGKVFLMLGDKSHKDDILTNINNAKGLGLSPAEISKLKTVDFIGLPFSMIKGALALSTPIAGDKLPGIPSDTANNELADWMRAVVDAYRGESLENMNLLLKGDNLAKYPAYKNIKAAFKKNDIYKFKIITNPEGIPADSELAKNPPKPGA